jgi:uncharacterized membrane protein
MSSLRTARIAFLVLLLAAGGQVLHYYPRLPESMASHFSLAGKPDGWQSRSAFFTLELLVVGILAAVFLLLPALLHRIPSSLINMPHREHWLAPERRREALDRLGCFLTWFGCASLLFLLAVIEIVIRVNLGGDAHLPGSWLWPLLGGYAAFLILWVIALVKSFRLPA